MSSDRSGVVREFLASLGLHPAVDRAAVALELENGWCLQLGTVPALSACLHVRCQAWEMNPMAERLLRANDIRTSRGTALQIFRGDSHLGLMMTFDGEHVDAASLRSAVETLVRLAANAARQCP